MKKYDYNSPDIPREIFVKYQIARKGYLCPNNSFDNPNHASEPVGAMCNSKRCPHFKKDCIVYGTDAAKRKWIKKERAFNEWRKNQPDDADELTLWAVFNAMDDCDKYPQENAK